MLLFMESNVDVYFSLYYMYLKFYIFMNVVIVSVERETFVKCLIPIHESKIKHVEIVHAGFCPFLRLRMQASSPII